MRLESFMNEDMTLNENIFTNMINKIKNKSKKALENLFKKNWIKITKAFKDAGVEDEVLALINSKIGTNYRSLDQISNQKIQESNRIDEDWKHFWDVISAEGFFNIKFWPALSIWMIIGNSLLGYLKGTPIDPTDMKAAAVYGAIWLALASGKFIKDFKEWKKQNQDEYYAERPKLATKHGYVFKDKEKDPRIKKSRAGFI